MKWKPLSEEFVDELTIFICGMFVGLMIGTVAGLFYAILTTPPRS